MIQQLELDGVRTLYAESEGLTRAGLMFRVGQADETLPRRGITHLVEHLALFPLNLTDYHSNGTTGQTTTHFYLEGDASDVVDFLATVCRSLAALPVGRIERERAVLRTEEARRSGCPALPGWRYGAHGYGLVSYAEWGNAHLGADDALGWARTWFTRENAVLWVAGPRLPEGIRLALPAGTPRPAPDAGFVLPDLPAWFASGADEIAMDTVVRRSAAAAAYAGVLGRELFRVLRQEGGWSYHVGAQYEPRDRTHATISAYADAHAGEDDAVLGAFVDVLANLRAGRIAEADIQAYRTQAVGRLIARDVDALRLPGEAADLLHGRPVESVEELLEEVHTLTTFDVLAVAQDAHAHMLLKVPQGRSGEWTGFAAAPAWSAHAVEGRRHAAIGRPEHALVTGPDGVTFQVDDKPVTVRFADCVGLLRWPDGRRVLIGRDGFTVTVEPTLLADGYEAVATIDAAVDPRVSVYRPARPDAEIPVPPPPAERGKPGRTPGTLRRRSRRSPVPDAEQPSAPFDPETAVQIGAAAPAWSSPPTGQGDLAVQPYAPGPRQSTDSLPRRQPQRTQDSSLTPLHTAIFIAFVVTGLLMLSAVSDWPAGGVEGEVVRGAWSIIVLLGWISFGVERSNRRRR